MKKKPCHVLMLEVARNIIKKKKLNEFTIKEVKDYVRMSGQSSCEQNTISTHVSSRCCKNAPNHHAVVYDYFERKRKGVYKISDSFIDLAKDNQGIQADEIRSYINKTYFTPGRKSGTKTVVVISGDVHKNMRLNNRYPNVCNAMGGEKIENKFNVKKVSTSGKLGPKYTVKYSL